MRTVTTGTPEQQTTILRAAQSGRNAAHASLLDTGMPAVAVINRDLPMTARPSGQRRAMHRDFFSRMMLTRSP